MSPALPQRTTGVMQTRGFRVPASGGSSYPNPWASDAAPDPQAGGYRLGEKLAFYRPRLVKLALAAAFCGLGYITYNTLQNEEDLLAVPVNSVLTNFYASIEKRRGLLAQIDALRVPENKDNPEARAQIDALYKELDAVEEQRVHQMATLGQITFENNGQDAFLRSHFPFHSFLLELQDAVTNEPYIHIGAARIVQNCCKQESNCRKILGWDLDPVAVLLATLERPRHGRGGFHSYAIPHVLQSLRLLVDLEQPNPAREAFEQHSGFVQVLRFLKREQQRTPLNEDDSLDKAELVGLTKDVIEHLCFLAASDPSILGAVPLDKEETAAAISVIREVTFRRLSMIPHATPQEQAELPTRVLSLAAVIQHLDPSDAQSLKLFGLQLIREKFSVEGQTLLRAALKAKGSMSVRFALARTLSTSGLGDDQQEAVHILQELRDHLEKHRRRVPKAWEAEAGFSLHEVLWLLGSLYERLDRMEDAIEAVRSSTRAMPESIRSHLKLAALLLRGSPNRTQIESALSELHTVLKLDATNYNAFLLLARAHELINQDDQAVKFFRDAAHQKPRVAEPHRRIALSYLRRRMPNESLAAWKHVVELDPTCWEAHHQMAEIYAVIEGPVSMRRLNMLVDLADAWAFNLDSNLEFFDQHPEAFEVYQTLSRTLESIRTDALAIGDASQRDRTRTIDTLTKRLQGISDRLSGKNALVVVGK